MKINKSPTLRFYKNVVRETLFPLLLMGVTINLAVVLPYIVVNKNSHLSSVFAEGISKTVSNAWDSVIWRDWEVIVAIAVILFWGVLSLVIFGGEEYLGPPTMSGFRPCYENSGFRFYLTSMLIVIPLIWYFPMLRWYYKLVTFAGYLSVFGILFCIFLYVKGHRSPSPGVFGSTGNPVFDFYWGLELYPRVEPDLDLKTLINCRFGLFLWQLVVLISWKANFELHQASYLRGEVNWPMTAATLLQTVYLAKFYYWEDGYMQTIDIAVDRFGFYVAWGCIAWVPNFYVLTSVYLVKHSPVTTFGFIKFIVTVFMGLSMIGLNYYTDRQKKIVRETNGKCDIWGKPAVIIHAVYEDAFGQQRRSVLLASGFWGLARHVNYAFEIGAAFVWSATASNRSVLPYLYVMFLVVLLIHRSQRDDEKCRLKYGKYWDEYCKYTPYKILPYVI